MLNTPLKNVLNTTKVYLTILETMNLHTVADLLLYFPRNYEIHNESNSITDFTLDKVNTIEAKVLNTISNLNQRTQRSIYKATLEDVNGCLFEAVWFAKPYKLTGIPAGAKRVFVGKAKYDFGKMTLISPKIDYPEENLHSKAIVPIYPQSDKITSDYLMKKIESLIHFAKEFTENLPEEIIKSENLMPRNEAIKQIHFPDNVEILEKARERLAFEELFAVQLGALQRKEEFQQTCEKHDIIIPMDIELVKAFFASLPFTPTNSQKVAIFEILQDLTKDYPMSRLLEGDVGSGKTLVAITASLLTVKASFQVAIMAPTEVLARQHFKNFVDLFNKFSLNEYLNLTDTDKTKLTNFSNHQDTAEDSALALFEQFMQVENKKDNLVIDCHGIKIAILLGAIKSKAKQDILLKLITGEINIIIGTHALIQNNVAYHRLGLAIIDEQHRFGVEQRQKLSQDHHPHVLNMTATPIPRTLAIVAYGDQDLSVLTEMPPGRKEIITKVVKPAGRIEINRFITNEIGQGRQVYVICPLVEDSKSEIMTEVKSVMQEYERLQAIFPNFKIGLMHGRLKSEEKEEVMQAFKTKQLQILVSTSVIEVGVDVANATIMLIEGAERFGLSQLHQFRGRVGRGEFQSYCFLFTSTTNALENDRLKAMEKFSDGFKLAEMDMRLRGPGEVYGVKQSGIPDLKMAKLTDQKFVLRVRQAAEKIINNTKI